MKKEQYIENRQFILDEIEKSKQLLKELDEEYIEKNKQFNVGDRVNKTGTSEFGYIDKFEVSYYNEVKPIILKEKKDKTPSKHSMYVYRSDDFQIANK